MHVVRDLRWARFRFQLTKHSFNAGGGNTKSLYTPLLYLFTKSMYMYTHRPRAGANVHIHIERYAEKLLYSRHGRYRLTVSCTLGPDVRS